MLNDYLLLGLCIAIAYFIGSVSSAIIVCRLAGLPDPRTQGSHNPGATNVLRLGGKYWALTVLLGDLLKGVLAVAIAKPFLPVHLLGWVGVAVVLGHLYPVFFRFQGGKGVATAAGVLLTLFWPLGVIIIACWVLIIAMTRYSSLAALIAALLAPLIAWHYLSLPNFFAILLISMLILWRHRSNIHRLLVGKEPRLGKK